MTQPVSAPAPDQTSRRKNHLPALAVFILTNLIFAAVYARFLTGSAVYMYADIGNDSLSSSYPLLVMLSRLFHEGRFPFYDLTFGAGTDITALYLQYLNPIKLFLLLFPTDHLPMALLIATVIQVNLLSLFGFIFFRTVLHDETAAVVPTLAWSFSGYVVLWGQNYSFLTCILLFTMTICLIRLTLAGRKKTITLWLIMVIALFLISNYYFLYMTAVFSVFYVIVWGLSSRKTPSYFFRKVCELILMAVFGAVMGCVSLLPIIRSFLDSNRLARLSEQTANAAASALSVAAASASAPAAGATLSDAGSALRAYDLPTVLTFVGRFLSTNLFGPGSGYRGLINYYEAAAPAVSALTLFALVYLIIRKSSRLWTLLMTVLCVAALALPQASAILNMNSTSQRWSFMISFGECLAIGFFIKALRLDRSRHLAKTLGMTLIVTPVITGLLLAALLVGRRKGWFLISPKALILFGACFVMYEIVLLLFVMRKSRQFLTVSLLFALTLELVLTNHITVNDRIYMTREAFTGSYYNNGAEKTAPAILASDPGLYRLVHTRQTDPALYGITATADKMFANEGMVNGYPGLSVYTSTLPSSLTSIGSAFTSEQGRSNFFIVDYDNYYLFTLLCGRYVFGEKDDLPLSLADPALYSVKTVEGSASGETILLNTNALPFGYLYTRQIAAGDFARLTAFERMQAVTQGYVKTADLTPYFTASLPDQVSDKSGSSGRTLLSEYESGRRILLKDLVSFANDCDYSESDGLMTVTATGPDPFVTFHLPEGISGCSLVLDLGMNVEDGRPQAIQIFSATGDYPSFGPHLCRDVTFSAPGSECVTLLPAGLTDLRLDTLPGETVTFQVASIYAVDPAADLETLKNSPVSNVSLTYDGPSPVYYADVTVDSSAVSGKTSEAMLCVPFPYHANWSASVDSEPVSTVSLNGGLIGVPLTEGSHQVKLTYSVPHFRLTALISLGALVLFLIVYGLAIRSRRT